MTWNTQDTNLSWYVPKANMDHTISGHGTADSTLDHSATTPRTCIALDIISLHLASFQQYVYCNYGSTYITMYLFVSTIRLFTIGPFFNFAKYYMFFSYWIMMAVAVKMVENMKITYFSMFSIKFEYVQKYTLCCHDIVKILGRRSININYIICVCVWLSVVFYVYISLSLLRQQPVDICRGGCLVRPPPPILLK